MTYSNTDTKLATSLQLDTLDKTSLSTHLKNCKIVILSNADYDNTYHAMLAKTLEKIDKKQANTPISDEIWLVEHQDVYTLGQAGKKEHILFDNGTPIIKTDRGGQVTWHGMGQLVAYFLFDLNELGWGVRDLVSHAEQAIEDTLNNYLLVQLHAKARQDAPGVYLYNHDGVMLGKIASLGFKIKHGHSYHGIAINLSNDPKVFLAINPCGYAGMPMLRLADFVDIAPSEFIVHFIANIQQRRQGTIQLR